MLIGLTGVKQAGKTTVANVLVTEFGFKQASFADPLRQLAYDINPVVGYGVQQSLVLGGKPNLVPVYYAELVDGAGYERAKGIDEVRRFLQRLGTEGMRKNFGEDVWVQLLASHVDPLLALGDNIVLADVRFPNEAAFVQQRGYLWRINRPGYESDGHASESHIAAMQPNVDITSSEIEDLRAQARAAYVALTPATITQ